MRSVGELVMDWLQPETPAPHDPARPVRCCLADLPALRRALEPLGRPLLVNHWSTWCAGCLKEMPRLRVLRERTRGRLDFLGIGWEGFVGDDAPDALLDAVDAVNRRYDLDWPTLIFEGKPEELFDGLELDIREIPQTFVLSADGAVLFHHAGALDEPAVERIEQLVRDAAGSGA